MDYNKSHLILALIFSSLTISGCIEKKEPKLPTFDPMVKVKQKSQGYSISGTIAVDSNNSFHHTEHLVSNYYNFDTKLPPLSLTAVNPSCSPTKANSGDDVHVIISRGGLRGDDLADIEQPSLIAFSNKDSDDIAQKRAQKYLETQTFKAINQSYDKWPQPFAQKNIIITENSKPVYIVLAGRWPTLYNFTVAPYSKVSGVMVYTDSETSAVSGLDPSVPVTFQSALSPHTKSCWVRTENKPDETWRGHKKAMRLKGKERKNSRYHALEPHYRKFASKIRKDVGPFTDSELISVNSGSYFLIGPPPTMLEQRIPYSPISGSHIRYMESGNIHFGMHDELKDYAYNAIHTKTKKILGTE